MNEKVLGTLAAGLKKHGEGLNHDWLKPIPVGQFRYRDSCCWLSNHVLQSRKTLRRVPKQLSLKSEKTMSSALTLSGGMPISLYVAGKDPVSNWGCPLTRERLFQDCQKIAVERCCCCRESRLEATDFL